MTTTDGFSELFTANERATVNDEPPNDNSFLPKFLADQIYGALNVAGSGGEGLEEEEEEDTVKSKKRRPEFGERYEIIGTLQASFHRKSEDILYVVNEEAEDFMSHILQCGFVIYNIAHDKNEIPKALETLRNIESEIEKLKEIGPKTFQNYSDLRVFVLLSTVMTWGTTKPMDKENPNTPFNEEDYKKRRPHPNYKEHINCEKEVVLIGKKYKNKLRTYVICCGIVYGEEEEDFSYYFRKAWNNEEYLPIFDSGKNLIPLIHIADLVRVIHGILETMPTKPQYILAVEQTPCSLRQIVKSLCKAMGKGKIEEIHSPEAFLDDSLPQTLYERYTVNLNMEPGFIVDDLELEWKNELNLAENMDNIVTEFRKSRNLKPLRILLHGPPGVGKSRLAEKICEIYGVQHITVKSMVEDILADMKDKLERARTKLKEKEEKENMEQKTADAEDEEAEEEGEEEEEPDIEDLEEQIKDIEGTMANSEDGKLPDEYVIRLMKKYLMSNRCQNQGYVIDGYPKTIEQARELFGAVAGAEEEVEEEEESGGEGAAKILPDHVITLQAPDDYLADRIMTLPEKDIQGTHYTEENMLRRLAIYRNNNTEDNTVLNFFDVLEIHPTVFDVTTFRDADMGDVLKDTCEKLGAPIGFGLTIEEETRIHECEEQELRIKAEAEKLEQELLEQRALQEQQSKMEEWSKSLEKLQKEEEKLVIAQSEPLRNYLMKYVFPTLTKGLIDVANYKPQDPVDYLAEYLFRENPEGHMFDPSYTREGELIADEKFVERE